MCNALLMGQTTWNKDLGLPVTASCPQYRVLLKCSGKIYVLALSVSFEFQFYVAPSGLGDCKNRPAPFPGRMSYKATLSFLLT